jgi:hypothetical protein
VAADREMVRKLANGKDRCCYMFVASGTRSPTFYQCGRAGVVERDCGCGTIIDRDVTGNSLYGCGRLKFCLQHDPEAKRRREEAKSADRVHRAFRSADRRLLDAVLAALEELIEETEGTGGLGCIDARAKARQVAEHARKELGS